MSRLAMFGRGLVKWRSELFLVTLVVALVAHWWTVFVITFLVLLVDGPPDHLFENGEERAGDPPA